MNAALLRSLGAAIAGFCAYGGWAYWVNMDFGADMGLRAGLVQGSWSFILTLTMTLGMELLLVRLHATGWAELLTLVVTVAFLFAGSYFVNWLFGTPEILMTILPGFLIGSMYSAIYIYGRRALASETGSGRE